MKRLFCLIIFTVTVMSCDKTSIEGGNSKIVGEWLYLKNEVLLDGKSVATDVQAVLTDAEDFGDGYLYFNSQHIFMPLNLTFTEDGYVISMGANIGSYSISNGKINIADNYSVGTIENGILTEVWTISYSSPEYVRIDFEEDMTYKASRIEVVTTYKKLK